MKAITSQKPLPEIMQFLAKSKSVYLMGCGTCATMCRTGGKGEVINMKQRLEGEGKQVTGWMIMPTACDELTGAAMKIAAAEIEQADAILGMTCSMGVQTIARYASQKPVYPGLDTLFVGSEDTPGHFIEVCMQCGSCVIGRTAAICPLVRCAKGLLNGPCGGSSKGKCEISKDIPCAWQLIYDRLKKQGKLDSLTEIEPIRDWSASKSGGVRKIVREDIKL